MLALFRYRRTIQATSPLLTIVYRNIKNSKNHILLHLTNISGMGIFRHTFLLS